MGLGVVGSLREKKDALTQASWLSSITRRRCFALGDCNCRIVTLTSACFRYALASAKYGSFRRAAAALNVQHSAVGRGVSTLEHNLGAQLFERGHAGIRPIGSYGYFRGQRPGGPPLLRLPGGKTPHPKGRSATGVMFQFENTEREYATTTFFPAGRFDFTYRPYEVVRSSFEHLRHIVRRSMNWASSFTSSRHQAMPDFSLCWMLSDLRRRWKPTRLRWLRSWRGRQGAPMPRRSHLGFHGCVELCRRRRA